MKCPQCQFENPSYARFCGKCATPLKFEEEVSELSTDTLHRPVEELTSGSTFAGRYQIIEEVGSGGMGRVYKVFDTEIREKIALKLIRPEVAKDESTIERFRDELRYSRRIGHRNVCRMFDLSKTDENFFITMEYVSGEDLKSFIRRSGRVTFSKAVSLIKQVCEGLAEAHRLGVVHRDLKPGNIMIDKEGNARIMDFGIARSLHTEGATGEGLIIGTPEYMSPEQVDAKGVDHRSDIYSLGIVLFELLTGRLPFEGSSPLSLAMKHKSEVPSDPRKFNPQIPDNLSRMILKCLEKNKGKRYQDMEELLSELKETGKGLTTARKVMPKRIPRTSREITVTLGLKKLFVPAVILIVVIIALVFISRLLPRKEAFAVPADKPSLAVVHFKNNTGDASLDHWRMALSDLLITDLSQSQYIRVLSGERIYELLEEMNQLEATAYSSDFLEDLASRTGIKNVIVGNYTKAGDTFRISITIQDARTGELIGSETVSGVGERSFYSMVDELTRRVKANFRISDEVIAADIDREVGVITSISPEALKYYTEGLELLRKDDYNGAIQLFEKAVAIDPEFAMAYQVMATAYSNLGYDTEERKYQRRAFALADRVSERELYLIEGEYYRSRESTFDRAIEASNKFLKLYPDDGDGNNRQGLLYKGLEEWEKAVERFQVCIDNKYDNFFYYVNFAEVYMAMGLYDRASKVLAMYLDNFPDRAWVHGDLAINYLCQRQFETAHAEVDRAYSLDPSHFHAFWIKGNIFQSQGEFAAAEREYQKLLEIDEQVAHLLGRDYLGALSLSQGRFGRSIDQAKRGVELAVELDEKGWISWLSSCLAYMYIKSGNPEEAIDVCNRVLDLDDVEERVDLQRRNLYFKGLALLAMGSIDEAQRAATEFRALVEKGMNRKEIRFYHHLMGMIELERKNFPLAIDSFNNAVSLMPYEYYRHPYIVGNDQAIFWDSLASAYNSAGNADEALEVYERIISLTIGRIHYGDIYANSFYMMGRIYEDEGMGSEAIEHYQKFLDLWKDADRAIPGVTDARKRLTGLIK